MANNQEGVSVTQPGKEQGRVMRAVRTLLALLGLAGIGGAVGYAIGASAAPVGRPEGIVDWFVLVPLYFLVLVFHELGHLVGGWLVRFRFLLLIVGPVRIAREQGQIRMGWNRSAALAGGLAASTPTDTERLRQRMAVVIAAGPVSSLLLALVAMGSLFVLPLSERAQFFVGITGLLSAMIFVVTAIPGRTSGFMTDGARLWMLLRGGAASERLGATLALTSLMLGTVRPRDWPPQVLEAATALPDGTLDDASASTGMYYHALDRGEVERAGRYLERALAARDALPAAARPNFFLEAAFFEGLFRRNATTARAWMDQATGGLLVEPQSRLRAEAAVLLAEGREAEAAKGANEGLEAAQRSSYLGMAEAEADWLRAILEAAQPNQSRINKD